MSMVRIPPVCGRWGRGRPGSHAKWNALDTSSARTLPVQSGKGGKGGKVGGKGGKGEGIVGGSLRASLPLRRWRRSNPTAISATTRYTNAFPLILRRQGTDRKEGTAVQVCEGRPPGASGSLVVFCGSEIQPH